jgi:archaellum component FlaC
VRDERSDLILNMLRAIRAKQDEHDRKFDEVITRLGTVERDFAGMKMDFAGMQVRLDDISRRLDRVERRLELTEA